MRTSTPKPRAERLAFGAVALGLLLTGCGATAPAALDASGAAEAHLEVRTGARRASFRWTTLSGEALSTESTEGRITVLGFLASYDDASLAEARFLVGLAKHHAPRLNVALLFLDPDENRPLVEAFVASLRLEVPAAIVDRATVTREDAFEGLYHVPSVVVLDRRGAEAFRNLGLIAEHDLERAVREVEARDKGR